MLVSDRSNLIYKIETNQAYALKICSPDITLSRLINEVEWLEALREDTNLIVPKPLPNQQGQMISQHADRLCVLFEWLDGEPVYQHMTLETARKIGEMMARLHLHALSYRPKNYIEDHFDYDYFFGFSSWWQVKAQEFLLDYYQDFVPAVNKAKRLFKSLNKSPDHFGLIHCDIHFHNVISNGNSLAIIDFGSCGLGHYFTDITITEIGFRAYPNAKKLISSFRKGYQKFRDYYPNSEEIKTFEVIAGLFFLELTLKNTSKNLQKYCIHFAMTKFWSLKRYKVLKYFIHKGLIFAYLELLIKRMQWWYKKYLNQGKNIK